MLPGEPLRLEERAATAGRGSAPPTTTRAGCRAAALGGEADPAWLAPRAADPVEAARAPPRRALPLGRDDRAGHRLLGPRAHELSGDRPPRPARRRPAGGRRHAGRATRARATSSRTATRADHVAFWLGGGRILHATRREGVDGVVEEPEPAELRARRHGAFRL